MLHIAICDDHKVICESIKEKIDKFAIRNNTELRTELFYNGEDLWEKLCKGQHYDLIFLDIELYGLNGIEIGQSIRETLNDESSQIVYISSKQNYAMELFKIRPLDFIVKPISDSRISRCIDLVQKRQKVNEEVFCFQNENITKNISLNQILYFQSDARKITIKHENGTEEFYGKLDEIEEKLENRPFMRIHQSLLVNYLKVTSIQKNEVLLKDGTTLQISQSRRKEVLNKLRQMREKRILRWK